MHNDSSIAPMLALWIISSAFACAILYGIGKYDGAKDVCANMCGHHYALEKNTCICLEVKK